MKTIAIVGTFDTKGKEYLYLKQLIEALGCGTLTINTGVFEPQFVPDISNEEVAWAAGEDIREIAARKDRAYATAAMARGVEALVAELYRDGKFDGIISFGGSGGTSLATPAMRALPIGVPKVMVSTMASGDTSTYVGTSDIVMMPSVVDVAGLNSISTTIFRNAAAAVVGMTTLTGAMPEKELSAKPIIAATMFGVTTPCITMAKDYLESCGYEVLVFHATGTGGKTMEALIRNGFISGVLDITTTEWCDELFGGVLNAGEDRCEAAALGGIPTVMSVGALDMVNFGPYDTVPNQFSGRNLYRHNPTVTLMRTTAEENKKLGEKLAEKLNLSTGAAALMLPLRGVSMIDVAGGPFYGPEEDKALFDALRTHVDRQRVELIELDTDINSELFALSAAKKLVELIETK